VIRYACVIIKILLTKYQIPTLSVIFSLIGGVCFAQFHISGKIFHEDKTPFYGVKIELLDSKNENMKLDVLSDKSGNFQFAELPVSNYRIKISHDGFQDYKNSFSLNSDEEIIIYLKKKKENLNIIKEVLIHGNTKHIENKAKISDNYLKQNFSGSLSESLKNVVGINSISIGSGTGKPVIRGLGFNRIAIAVNSIKHEGQQWGADHGLEIDAFMPENVEIIKGTSSLEYGSDAIGGVLIAKNNSIIHKNGFNGKATILGRSVNNTAGIALDINHRKNKFLYKIKTSYLDYSDYKTTADTIVYLTRKIPIHNKILKNTAGNSNSFFAQIGYILDDYHSLLSFTNNYSKEGFFPGSHGIPDIRRLEDDGKKRNIDFPYQRVNHFTLQNEHKWKFINSDLFLDLSFQNNHRQEFSEFHTHYSNQIAPDKDRDLELDFDLNTISGNIKYTYIFSENHKTNFGFQTQFQDNKIKGYNFLLPKYNRKNLGLYFLHNYDFSDKFKLEFGARYDISFIKIGGFYDKLLYNYLIDGKNSVSVADSYANRSPNLSKKFENFNAKTGIIYSLNKEIDFRINAGSNFRIPTAIELGANGVHHGSFRHEKGDENLNPEKGYSLDFQLEYTKNNFYLNINPYLYYFTNYIFLKPTLEFSLLPHSGQIYKFSQTEAILSGFEASTKYSIGKLSSEISAEYIINKEVKRKISLPFSPAFNVFIQINYNILKNTNFFFNGKYFARQERIAQGEEITPESLVLGTGFFTEINLNRVKPKFSIQITNLANISYFNHINFYRALEIPEQARNIQIMLEIPF